jgi:ABC-type hemin transport system substrate-binding protein
MHAKNASQTGRFFTSTLRPGDYLRPSPGQVGFGCGPPPQRVVSLVPAVTTEMIVAIGAGVALAALQGVSTHPDQGP